MLGKKHKSNCMCDMFCDWCSWRVGWIYPHKGRIHCALKIEPFISSVTLYYTVDYCWKVYAQALIKRRDDTIL